ncbi:MAG: polyribonucleotide nucleotidyltransferase [Candidatus Omnitrophica bacterium]|nr:polyribonucleotide nucleotidyltransferase [Candidatus Omnitrophota bacterium]
MQTVKRNIEGQEYILETGRMAKQAHGAVTLQCGGTVILAAVVSDREAESDQDFFPLTVDYRERTYAAGKIPGGYFKREGRPTEKEILTSRLIDRPIRPMFPENFLCDTQISVTVLSVDSENATDILSMNAASSALLISDIPFENPLGAVRVGLLDGNFVLNPSLADVEKSDLDLVLAGSEEKIAMIEAGANELTEEKILEAIRFGHEGIRQMIALQRELQRKAGKKKRKVESTPLSEEAMKKMKAAVEGQFEKVFELDSKEEREEFGRELYKKAIEQFDKTAADYNEPKLKMYFDKLEKDALRKLILEWKKRPDKRGFQDIRPIICEVSVLPRTHGSALFTRGQTQSLCVTTLGTGDDEQMIDALEGERTKTFMLHYNFPHFSVGETGPNRGPGRREIGHGALAERALKSVMPTGEDFPYTVRLVSDILESNGSSSMASVCGGTLALMDAGVPLKAPVAGIALGLLTAGDKWQVMTDIAGIEDHHGDMDFKAAGTRKGLTAIQMDLKIDGVSEAILKESFHQAKAARFKILDLIAKAIEAPRATLSNYAPRITTLKINPEKIGELIGPGGKNIRKIVEETGAKIDIEDDGRVFIASVDAKAAEAAIARVQAVAEEPELGKIYQGKVRKLMAFGAFCEIIPGKDGLVHVSEVADGFVKNVADYLKVGDIVPVKVMAIDPETGKVSLSIKEAKPGGMTMLPADVERDVVSEPSSRGRDRGGSRSRR